MVNRRFVYTNDKKITAQIADETNVFLWMAFNQNSDGNCILEKQTAFEPTQTFFTIERAVNEIVALSLDANDIYVAYNDSTIFAEKFALTNPLTSSTQINFPGGIIESPVDIKVNGSDVFILTPGDASGENAKILRYNTSLVLQETIDLTKSGSTVNSATSMVVDSSGDIWVITYTDPAQYIRVYQLSGGGWDFTVHNVV